MITPLIKLRGKLTKKKLDGILISSIPNIIYLTNYSGFSKEEREAYLFVVRLASKRAKEKQYILTDGRYSQAVKTLIPDFNLIEISSKVSAISALKKLIKKHEIKKLAFEGNNMSFLEHKKISLRVNNLNHLSLTNLRAIKNKEEFSAIEKACKLGDKTFSYILRKIKEGISEKEIAFEIEFFIKKTGADISFRPIVAFGKNSAIPHHVPTNNKLTNNQTVLLDFGVKLNNYCSDMTRTVFFGKPTNEQKKMYQAVLEAQTRAIDYLYTQPSILSSIDGSKVDKIAREYIISQGYKTIPHSVGHGIGIEVHESPHLSPKSKDVLKPGMVFTIEPGIYIPGFGGVRIEDVVSLEKYGPRILTKSTKDIIQV